VGRWVAADDEKFLWRAADLANRSEGASEKVVVEEVLRAVAEDDTGSGHYAAQRVPDFPYLARQLSGGETRTDPQGGYPSGCRLIDGGSGPKSVGGSLRMELGNPGETRETHRFILVWASGE
jgi:hypothetical protein